MSTASLAWENLSYDLQPWLKDAIKSMGFITMTPVQAATIPLFCANKDVVVEAMTGSGKTMAFAIPVLERISRFLQQPGSDGVVKKGHMLGIVLAPTRELANQINVVFQAVLQFQPESHAQIRTQLLVGSLALVREDLNTYTTEKPHILIATPGRMLDFLSLNMVRTPSLEILVLDEADKLLDVSFEMDVRAIIRQLPRQRRTGLFSATLSAAGDTIFKTGMTNPVKICVKAQQSGQAMPASLGISYLITKPEQKLLNLLVLLNNYHYKKAIVYFPTCTGVTYFFNMLSNLVKSGVLSSDELKFFSLHGKLQAKPRIKTLNAFTDASTSGGKSILMTTDVAARGIDIPDVELVIQMDAPTDPDVFLHRCGRTGRANKVGKAIVLLNEGREEDYLSFMLVRHVDMALTTVDLAPYAEFAERITTQVRTWIMGDRARHELGVKSFVGFVRYYSKHQASSIFRMQSLDYLGLARMYGLMRLPKMPESRFVPRDLMPEEGWLGEKIDMDAYAYKDPQKEASRLEVLEAEKQKRIEQSVKRKELKHNNAAWSDKTDTKEGKAVRREKMKRKREAIQKQIMEEPSDNEDQEVDWKEMVRANKKKKTANSGMQGSFDDL